MQQDIKALFEPRSIAVIGASQDKSKVGYSIVRNILSGGYRGKIFPVNPRGGSIQGIPVYRTLEDIPDEVDVACISIPAKLVLDAVKSCTRKGVKFGVIITSGFSEVGNTQEEQAIVLHAREHGMGILGPNIFGLYSAASSLNCTFGPEHITPGSVGIITQSGAIGLAMIGKTAAENIGLSAMVSVGNKSDIDEADLLEYLVPQDRTKIILMYIEGVKDGEKLAGQLRTATAKKPVIVIKSGRSAKGAMAAASHTGSLAGSDEVFDHVMRQCGVLRAESLREAFDWCNFFSNNPLPKGENTLIITNGGGIGVMAADACEKYGVQLYDDTRRLKDVFASVVPAYGSSKNPIDLTAEASSDDYDAAFEMALNIDSVHAVLGLYCETAVFDKENLAEMVSRNDARLKAGGKPASFSLLGGESTVRDIETLEKQGVTVVDDVYQSVSPLGAMFFYHRYLHDQPGPPVTTPVDMAVVDAVVSRAMKEGRTFLFSQEAQLLIKSAGIAVPKSGVARTIEEAVKLAKEMGYPVVMKVVSKDILHKSDAGGVMLDLLNEEEVVNAYQAIVHNSLSAVPNAVIEGIEVAEMVSPGTEMIAGSRRDKIFGPIAMVGLGGIYVEVIKDVTFRALPLDRKEVIKMIKELKTYPLLLGVRGEKTKDQDALVDTTIRLGSIIRQCPHISDIEINPLMVYEQGMGVKAVDIRILLSKQAKGINL
ncbi:MAG: acetate--CoA ligase family protein [Syntrophobacterales bacterium]|nr:acetate--CoA ligase family protein [Syntrophobacterales bacterium]